MWSVVKGVDDPIPMTVPGVDVRSAQPHDDGAPRFQTRAQVEVNRAKEYLKERALVIQQQHMEEAKREIELEAFYKTKGGVVEDELVNEAEAHAIGPTNAPADSDSDGSSSEEDELTIKDREATKRR